MGLKKGDSRMTTQRKQELYLTCFSKAVRNFDIEVVNDNFKRVIFYGIKAINRSKEPTNYEGYENTFQLISTMKDLIGKLTPNEFMNIFPIKKDFTGYKYEMKDYYSSIEFINNLDRNKPIGDNVSYFLMEYTNKDIDKFVIKSVMTLSRLREQQGHLDLFEELMASEGHETPNTFKNSKGQAMYVKGGRPTLIKGEARKLKLVK